MLEPGAEVAGYRIERVLGAGGMGVVYLVANPELPRKDALKVLSAELSSDADFRARFTREADVASQLDHPNITAIYRRGTTDDGQLWIAMQFVDGTDADAALKAGTITPARAVHIVGEVAKALDYAHGQGVVHRDIKPANFLLSGKGGSNERILLADFGIARALDDAAITVSGSVTATLAYAAPEVISGDRVDGRADIYSLGCALYRMLTGKAPYHAEKTPGGIMAAHMRQAPPSITAEVPTLPRALDLVIAKAMAKDPAQRYATAGQLADAAAAAFQNDRTTLTPILPRTALPPRSAPAQPPGQPPIQSPPPRTHVPQPPRPAPAQPQYQPAPPPPRYQAPAGGWAAGPQAVSQYPPSGPVQPTTKSGKGKIYAAIGGVVLLVVAGISIALLTGGDDSRTVTNTSSSETTTTTTPTGPPVASTALPGLLLGPAEVANLVGATGIKINQATDQFSDDASVSDNKDCIGVQVPVQQQTYASSGWTAVHQQMSRSDNEGDPTHSVTQAVVAFPGPEFAQRSLREQSKRFQECAGKSATATLTDPPNTFTFNFGQPTTIDGMVTMVEIQEGANGWGCQRAVGAQNNVVVDVMVCRIAPGDQAAQVAKAILKKVPN